MENKEDKKKIIKEEKIERSMWIIGKRERKKE